MTYNEWLHLGQQLQDNANRWGLKPIELPKVEPEPEDFRAQLLKDIPYFHRLSIKYNDPKWLEIAQNLGIVLKGLSTPPLQPLAKSGEPR